MVNRWNWSNDEEKIISNLKHYIWYGYAQNQKKTDDTILEKKTKSGKNVEKNKIWDKKYIEINMYIEGRWSIEVWKFIKTQ